MVDPQWPSPFVEPVAVEAWDAWFRWREGAHVHDVSIEDTWHRVANALAAVEAPPAQAHWRARFFDELASWRLLPDARLLEAAGTGSVTWRSGTLCAALNAGVFVRMDAPGQPRLDFAAMAACGALAVRMLDNAGLTAGLAPRGLQVGLLGVADALALLGLDYDSDAARAQAGLLARALAAGCIEASAALARERGGGAHAALPALASLRATSPGVRRTVQRCGLRHTGLTATTSQRRIALLANDAADALDPPPAVDHRYTLATPAGTRTVSSSGYARQVLRHHATAAQPRPPAPARAPWMAQLAMRAAVQPWMDAPIDYPLVLEREPASVDMDAMLRAAATQGLRAPGWRCAALPP